MRRCADLAFPPPLALADCRALAFETARADLARSRGCFGVETQIRGSSSRRGECIDDQLLPLARIRSDLAVGFGTVAAGPEDGERGRRREARRIIGAYHEEQLRLLLEHVRDGFARMDAGEIDPFDLDDLIHHYKNAARELWKFCGSSGGQWDRAARTLEYLREQGEEPPDWWAAGDRRRRDR